MHWLRNPMRSRVSMITLEKHFESRSSYWTYFMTVPLVRFRCRARGRRSQHSVLFVNLAEKPSLQQLVAGVILAGRLLERALEHFVLDRLGHDHDAVVVAEYEIARLDFNAAALDGDVDVGHEAAPPRVERHDAARERRKAHRDDALHVAHDGVDDGSVRAAHPGGGREQLAPRSHRPRVVGAVNGDVAGAQRIDRPDLVDVRIGLDGLVSGHPQKRPGATDHDEIRVQRPDVVPHRLVPQPEIVESIGHDRRVELLANPAELLLVRFPGHGSSSLADYESNTMVPASGANEIQAPLPGAKRLADATWTRQRIAPDSTRYSVSSPRKIRSVTRPWYAFVASSGLALDSASSSGRMDAPAASPILRLRPTSSDRNAETTPNPGTSSRALREPASVTRPMSRFVTPRKPATNPVLGRRKTSSARPCCSMTPSRITTKWSASTIASA